MTWDIKGKTVFITGATDGIGQATAQALAKRGARLILTARTKEKGERAVTELKRKTGNDAVEYIECDLASFASIKRCAEEYKKRFQRLDVLISVAGVMPLERQTSQDGIELNMAVNYFAPVLLEELLLPLIEHSAPARIINVTSSTYALGDIDLDHLRGKETYERYDAYGTSKLALMLYTKYLADSLRGSGIAVNTVHPGWIRTKLAIGALGKSGFAAQTLLPFLKMRPAWYGARSIVYLAADPAAGELQGEYIIKNQPAQVKAKARDAELGVALAKKTKEILSPFL